MNPDNEEQAMSHFLWQLMIWAETKKAALVTCSNRKTQHSEEASCFPEFRENTENVFPRKKVSHCSKPSNQYYSFVFVSCLPPLCRSYPSLNCWVFFSPTFSIFLQYSYSPCTKEFELIFISRKPKDSANLDIDILTLCPQSRILINKCYHICAIHID